ncbi:MAG: hypothetical protein KIS94_01635 [Chitinophagales bacterium]|nr:hypothetical protein [Chitinophagales bacterium]
MNTELKNHLIEKYRESIKVRYDYDAVKMDKRFPKKFTRETVDELRTFFLENLYSPPAHREKLDAAFKQLETYVAHPSKIWGLLGNLATAVFKFGFHFPAALRTGMVALQTHTTARHFEDMLLQNASDRDFQPPLTDAQFNECLAALDGEMLIKFIGELTELFVSISDTELMEKTISILKDVLTRMKDRKDIYGPEDHDAIQLGIDILEKGYVLLSKYDDETKRAIVEFVTYSETGFIESLKPKKGKKSVVKS